MRSLAGLVCVLAALALPASALAGEQTLVLRSQQITVPGYGVSQGTLLVPSPSVDGYVVGLDVDVVDESGAVQGDDEIMLHHVVFARFPGRDFTCGSPAERFFALGEERFVGGVRHDVTLVSGPVGFSAPWTLKGTFAHRFTRRGTYKLFCSLHPAQMVQEIVVR